MARKLVDPSPSPDPESPENPIEVADPEIEVLGEGKRSDDGKTTNELVVQRVSVPFVSKERKKKGNEWIETKKVEWKKHLRVFVRPDEAHDEPDSSWDEHEPEDEAAIRQLFATHGKGIGTRIEIRSETDAGNGETAFVLDVRRPKKGTKDEDARFPFVIVDPKSHVGDLVFDLFYEMSDEDRPDDFLSRGALEDSIEESKGDLEELEPIRSLLDEFDMPGDLPAKLYSLPERLRSIFQTAKRKP